MKKKISNVDDPFACPVSIGGRTSARRFENPQRSLRAPLGGQARLALDRAGSCRKELEGEALWRPAPGRRRRTTDETDEGAEACT